MLLLLPRSLLLATALLQAAVAAAAFEAGGDAPLPAVAAAPPTALAALAPDVRASLWGRSLRHEEEGEFLAAAELRMRILARDPHDVHVLWRTARDLLHDGSDLVTADPAAAARSFEAARDFARRGRQQDASCGECCLYEFAATARLAAVRGLARQLAAVRAAGDVLEQCLATPPTWEDDLFGAEAAHLYYGGAVYYRMLPESRWLGWLGVQGDAGRAVALARRAAAEAPGRVDYQVELGAALLCLGAREGAADARREGQAVLESVLAEAPGAPDVDRALALLADPGGACGSSAHGEVSWR